MHIHSNASDGSLSPKEILSLAVQKGLRVISITDHDTIDGVRQLLQQPLSSPIEFLAGVEISCVPPPGFEDLGSIHLLGYGFSIYDKGLNTMLANAQKARATRNPKIIEKLNSLGFDIRLDQVERRFGADQTGRPHIAQFMVEKGYVDSFGQVFEKFLGEGCPAYVGKI